MVILYNNSIALENVKYSNTTYLYNGYGYGMMV